jgi:predicted nucleotidyltransferase
MSNMDFPVTLAEDSERSVRADKYIRLRYNKRMNRHEILAGLRENEAALRARGVSHAALFGSRARGDDRPDSDTDIMVEIDPEAHIGVWDYAGLKEYIASLFEGEVDVIDREALKPYVAPAAVADALYAF